LKQTLHYIFSLLVCISISSLFITCQKEYSFEKDLSQGTAGFSINCSNSSIVGSFYIAKTLDSSNKLQLEVDVSTIGTYKLSTNAINGFSFSDSGRFTRTGVQTITLTGNGQPTAIGNFTFTITRNGNTCSFIVNVQTAPITNAVFTLAGAPNSCDTPTVRGLYVINTALGSSNTVQLKVNVISIGAYRFQTDTVNGIYFSTDGIFTNTGIQFVTLNGNGTPLLPRNAVFTPQIAGPRCSFVVPNVLPGPYAEYVLESMATIQNTCLYSFAGNYIVNTQLTSSNTVTIQIFVVRLGSYAVATNPVNGMQFLASGTFTSTGPQALVLTGSGTPRNVGTFLFKPEIVGPSPLGGAFCTFEIQVR
jgi:hypothetical protein